VRGVDQALARHERAVRAGCLELGANQTERRVRLDSHAPIMAWMPP
jgi:hypothetical protein